MCYPQSRNDPGYRPRTLLEVCCFCHEGGFHPDEMREFGLEYACVDCATHCPACSDWMANEPEVVIDGQRWHRACAEESGMPPTPIVHAA